MVNGKRLIDANALFPGKILAVNIKNPMETVEDLMNRINNAPTVDAVEVVHGEWIWTKEGEDDWLQYWVCSGCSEVTFFRTNYCPNCGAKMMDGDGNGK